jgi:hypothetical protein
MQEKKKKENCVLDRICDAVAKKPDAKTIHLTLEMENQIGRLSSIELGDCLRSAIVQKGVRGAIGEKLFGRKVIWGSSDFRIE